MKGSTTNELLADSLVKDGSLWFESAFCKRFNVGALLFSDPVEVVSLFSLSGLECFFQTLEKKLAEGYYLAGWLSYEVGYGFEQALFAAESATSHSLPLAWFGVYREPEHCSESVVEKLFSEQLTLSPGVVSLNLSWEEYAEKIKLIKMQIAAGSLYQVNFTGRYRFTFNGSAPALFRGLRGSQPSSYTALLNCGERTILSFSPELFFSKCGSVIETRPMKGTAPRGSTIEEDCRQREELARCKKNLAENLMIVDLLRNDLGRICRPGSIETEKLFATETYPTLHQMVSTIRGEMRENVGLYELFKALYPSGSITGAPKIKAMKWIQSLETEPRGIYTGAIGFITPDLDMLFNVAIRTIDLSGGEALYGSGSGIVWDSDAQEEYRECQLKAKILTDASNPHLDLPESILWQGSYLWPEEHLDRQLKAKMLTDASDTHFDLFESILWQGGYLWLEEHLDRIGSSASVFSFPCNKSTATLILTQLEEELRHLGTRFKVKLTLSFQGEFTVSYEHVELLNPCVPLRLCLAVERTNSSHPFLYHKTTKRELYNRSYSLGREKGYDEVLFMNEREELTEGAISNLFIRQGHHFFTPPVSSGLLNGIFRQYFLVTRTFAQEKTLTLPDLLSADTIYTANSVRGLRPALFTSNNLL